MDSDQLSSTFLDNQRSHLVFSIGHSIFYTTRHDHLPLRIQIVSVCTENGIDRRVLERKLKTDLIIITADATSRVHASKVMSVILYRAERMKGANRQGWKLSKHTRFPRNHTGVDDPRL